MVDDANSVAAARLRTLREERGLSRRAAVDALEEAGIPIHLTTLRRMEAGSQPLRLSEASALAGFYGVTLDSLVTPRDEAAELRQIMADAAGLGRRLDAAAQELYALDGRFDSMPTELTEGNDVLREALDHLAAAVVGLTEGLSSESGQTAEWRLEEGMYDDRGAAEAEVDRMTLKTRVEEYLAGLRDGSR